MLFSSEGGYSFVCSYCLCHSGLGDRETQYEERGIKRRKHDLKMHKIMTAKWGVPLTSIKGISKGKGEGSQQLYQSYKQAQLFYLLLDVVDWDLRLFLVVESIE